MAVYHLSIKPIGRGSGRSAVAAAAYRAGERLVDARTGLVHDYSRRSGVAAGHLVMPSGSAWRPTRNELWDAAERAEKRKDARTAREYEVALPFELHSKARATLALQFARELADRFGVAVDVAVHAPGRRGDARNWHAHLLATTRRVTPEGFGEKADLELADAERRKRGLPRGADEVVALRELWAGLVNGALQDAGTAERVDHRSLEARGGDRDPQPKLGVVALAMEARGLRTDRGDEIRGRIEIEGERSALLDLIERGESELRQIGVDPAQRYRDSVAALAEIERARRRIEQERKQILSEDLPDVPELPAIAARWSSTAEATAARAVQSEAAWRRWWRRLWSHETRAAVARAQLLREVEGGRRPVPIELLEELRAAQRRRKSAELNRSRQVAALEQALVELGARKALAMRELGGASQATQSLEGTIQRDDSHLHAQVTMGVGHPEVTGTGRRDDPRM
jgi:hypothetical protein